MKIESIDYIIHSDLTSESRLHQSKSETSDGGENHSSKSDTSIKIKSKSGNGKRRELTGMLDLNTLTQLGEENANRMVCSGMKQMKESCVTSFSEVAATQNTEHLSTKRENRKIHIEGILPENRSRKSKSEASSKDHLNSKCDKKNSEQNHIKTKGHIKTDDKFQNIPTRLTDVNCQKKENLSADIEQVERPRSTLGEKKEKTNFVNRQTDKKQASSSDEENNFNLRSNKSKHDLLQANSNGKCNMRSESQNKIINRNDQLHSNAKSVANNEVESSKRNMMENREETCDSAILDSKRKRNTEKNSYKIELDRTKDVRDETTGIIENRNVPLLNDITKHKFQKNSNDSHTSENWILLAAGQEVSSRTMGNNLRNKIILVATEKGEEGKNGDPEQWVLVASGNQVEYEMNDTKHMWVSVAQGTDAMNRRRKYLDKRDMWSTEINEERYDIEDPSFNNFNMSWYERAVIYFRQLKEFETKHNDAVIYIKDHVTYVISEDEENIYDLRMRIKQLLLNEM